jgi:hypothetical protein
MPQQQRKIPLSASLLALSVVSGSALAGVTQDVEDALNFYHYGKNGAVKFDLNTRWENVDQPGNRPPSICRNTTTHRQCRYLAFTDWFTVAGIPWHSGLRRIRRQPCHAG